MSKKNKQEEIKEEAVSNEDIISDEEVREETSSDIEKELDEARKKADENYDMFLRERAELINFRKRNELAVSRAVNESRNETVLRFLPVLDNLDRAIDAATEESALLEGIELVRKQMLKALEDLGVHEIEAEGKHFDPNLHNAVMQVEPEEGEESGIVKQVLQKGYKTDDVVIRHSMVTVTK